MLACAAAARVSAARLTDEHDGAAADVRHGLLLAAGEAHVDAAQFGVDFHGHAAAKAHVLRVFQTLERPLQVPRVLGRALDNRSTAS